MDFQVAQTSSINSPCLLQAYLVHLMYLVQNVVFDVGVQQVVGDRKAARAGNSNGRARDNKDFCQLKGADQRNEAG